MALKYKFKAKEEIPSEHQGLYAEREGAWVLDVEDLAGQANAVVKAKLDELLAAPQALSNLLGDIAGVQQRLADLDLAKKNFVSSVTHELRSPLGAIESFLPLIREKVSSGDPQGLAVSAEYLDRIAANVQRLNRFITDLLDVAKIEQGRMECVMRPLDFAPIAAEVVQFFEAKSQAQNVVVENRVAGMPAVLGDADRVRQVLVNLLANALKFTSSGGKIWIAAELVRDEAGRWLEITVGDTGRGMDDADRKRLFQPFAQGANVNQGVTGHKGTGLGLYIVKSIIAQHGGRVELKSVLGQGTQFIFSLKVAS